MLDIAHLKTNNLKILQAISSSRYTERTYNDEMNTKIKLKTTNIKTTRPGPDHSI